MGTAELLFFYPQGMQYILYISQFLSEEDIY